MTLSEAIEIFKAAIQPDVAPRTLDWYDFYLGRLCEGVGPDRDITAITLADLRLWRASFPATYSVWTVTNHIRTTRRLFKWLADEGHISADPSPRLKKPNIPNNEPRAMDAAHISAVLDYARQSADTGTRAAIRNYAIVRLLVETGCRSCGVCGLAISDLDLDNGRATVTEKGKVRTVYFGKETKRALVEWLNERPQNDSDTLFIGKGGKPIQNTGLRYILDRLCDGSGVTGRNNPHSIRHAFARRLLTNGADLGTVADLMGHEGIETTHAYYARWGVELQQRHERFNGL